MKQNGTDCTGFILVPPADAKQSCTALLEQSVSDYWSRAYQIHAEPLKHNPSPKLTISGPAFSVVRQARMGGGPQRPGCQNQGYHQPIEMKLCMSQYSHESMPDAKLAFFVLEISRHKISL